MFWKFIIVKIKKHNEWILALHPIAFIGTMLFYDLFLKSIVSLCSFLISLKPDENSALSAVNLLQEKGIETVIIETILFAPILETIACQWLPIWFIEKFTKRGYILVGVSTMVFTLSHWFADFIMLTVVFVGGVIFSFSYVRWKYKSIWLALGITTIVHCISNALAVGLALLD